MPFGSNRGRSCTSNNNASSFGAFLEAWLVRQEHYLDELLTVLQSCHESSDDDLRDLIARVLAHYQQYYQEKSRAAKQNVFLMFSPTWFTPFERTFLWIAGFKPGLVFRLVASSVNDLTEDQNRRVDQLKEETKVEERQLANELARIQESVAAPPMLELARAVDGEIREVDTVLEKLRSAMESLVASADLLRSRTTEKVVGVLCPVQNVRFLAAATQLQLKIRTCGLQKEAERHAANKW